jgi:demethylmenaquinone methyltransferase/2-methoxy-6-polyprenyl-1,4-benzoquinol methylase
MSREERTAQGGSNRFARRLFSGLPSRYDQLVEWLTMWQNRRWRRAMVDAVLTGPAPSGPPVGHEARMLDVASGTAGVALQVASRRGARVVGVDLSLEMLSKGAVNVAAATGRGAAGAVELAAARAEQLPFPDATFDGLTFTYLLRYVEDVEATVAELARVLKPGAPIASLDFAVPQSSFWRSGWWVYTRLLLPVAGLLSGGAPWWRVGRFLGPNISGFYSKHPVPSLIAAWRAAGLVDVRVRTMSLGGGIVMSGRRADG